jgi:hypothetical protein
MPAYADIGRILEDQRKGTLIAARIDQITQNPAEDWVRCTRRTRPGTGPTPPFLVREACREPGYMKCRAMDGGGFES